MNLRHLTDACLLRDTKRLATEERELLTTILHHLMEIDRRRLFGTNSSLHTYACAELKYSDDQAQRRTSAMRVMRELPRIETWIKSGEINLTHIGLAKSLFKQRKKAGAALSHKEKLEVFEAMAGHSTRKAQGMTHEMNGGAPLTKESIRALGHGRFVLTIEINAETLADLEKLRGLRAHKHPDLTIGELFGQLAALGLETWNPAREPRRRTNGDSKAAVRRAVWRRDAGACVQCGSTHALEIDHIEPVAMGGADTLENMRLLCRCCNQRAAVERFGVGKMDPFISPAAPRVKDTG